MALQLTGAYKRSALANLQIRLPAVVIGGGLTAIDTATELLAYYIVQVEKTAERIDTLVAERGEAARAWRCSTRRSASSSPSSARHAARGARRARARPRRRGARRSFQPLLDAWGGVSLVYRKRVVDSPAYRLNHEEVIKCARGGRALHREPGAGRGAARRARRRAGDDLRAADARRAASGRATGEIVELPARCVCVAAGTSPNVTYEKEQPGSFAFDKWKQFFQAHTAVVDDDGKLVVDACRAEGRLLHELRRRRARGELLRRQPPALRGQRRQGDGERAATPSRTWSRSSATTSPRLGDEPQAARDARRRALFAQARRRAPSRSCTRSCGSRRPSSRSSCARPRRRAQFSPGPVLPPPELREHSRRRRRAPASPWRASRSPAPGSTRRRGCSR